MEEHHGNDRQRFHGDTDDEFTQWLTTIQDEIDSTANILKDEATIVKVRKIVPNLEILRDVARAGNGRVRKNAIIGLDETVTKAIKSLQRLRANLKEESLQLFKIPVDDDGMDVANTLRTSTQPIVDAHGKFPATNADTEVLDIRESRGDNTAHSPSSKNMDLRHPRDLFPPEVWELIFDKLEDSLDWLNLYRVSSYFLEVMVGNNNRITALFPQVFPHVFKYLGGSLDKVLLPLRLVSRSWKAAVDTRLEKCGSVGEKGQLRISYTFSTPASFSSFLSRFDAHAGNPFVGRFAIFSYNYRSDSNNINIAEYSRLAIRLLDKFGAQLKSLEITVIDAGLSVFATEVLGCVRRVPNLESLRVYHHCVDNLHGDVGELLLSPTIEMGGPLLLPLLPNLKSISFSLPPCEARCDVADLQNKVIRLCCNPNSLENVRTIGFPSALQSFPNLKSATVILYAREDVAVLPSPPWPLTKLTVFHRYDNMPVRFFKCVEHFRATLTSLHLQRPTVRDPLKSKFDLPQLKQLTITSEQHFSLDYLTALTNLEVLSIDEYFPSHFRRTGARVQVAVARWRLWEVLPKLKAIRLIQMEDGERIVNYCKKEFVATRSNREFRWI